MGLELVLPFPPFNTGIHEMDVPMMPLSPGLWIISFFAYFIFYLCSFSFSPITCIESTWFLILTLAWLINYLCHSLFCLFFIFLWRFLHNLLQFYLHYDFMHFFTCISYETNTFILYIPRMFLNSWFVSMFYGHNWRIVPWGTFLTSIPLEAGVSYKRIWLPGFFHSPTSYKAKNYCESPWIWDSGEGVVLRMF